MDDFIPGEQRPLANGVEQSERSAAGRPVTTPSVAHLRRHLENGAGELTSSRAKPSSSSSYNDSLDRHMNDLGQLIATQVELVEENKLKGHKVEPSQKLLITLNELMANYQILRQRNERRG
jgi:hypothetical protein